MKVFLVYPEHPPQTHWSSSGALPYIERRAALSPLSLVTLAAMLPEHWDLRLIEMNVALLDQLHCLQLELRTESPKLLSHPWTSKRIVALNWLSQKQGKFGLGLSGPALGRARYSSASFADKRVQRRASDSL